MSPLVTVLIGTSLLGCVAGVVGSFAVLRRRALVGDLIAHAALPGICLAFLVVGERRFTVLLAGALATGLLGVGLITAICRLTRIKEDAAIGIVLSTFFGGGIVLSSLIQHQASGAGKAGLDRYIYGQAAGMIRQDLLLIAGVSVAALLVIALFYKEFKTLSFDPGFAQVQGWPTLALDLTMMAVLGLVTVVGLPAVGVVLMAAMLIGPSATARLWTNRLEVMIVLAGVLGAAAAVCGTLLSAGTIQSWLGFDPLAFGHRGSSLPTGPLIVLCGSAFFLISLAIAPDRGLIARSWQRVRLRRKTADENLLRSLYDLTEDHLADRPAVSLADLLSERAWSHARLWRILGRALRHGYVERTGGGVRLTERGLERAADLTRRHRLWELYLIRGADIAPDHVDRDADAVEHLLPAEIVRELEAELAQRPVMSPAPPPVPESPHEIKRPSG